MAAMNTRSQFSASGDEDMLSFMVSEALDGVDLAKRYPTYYKKLLSDPELREAFVDSIDLIEMGSKRTLVPLLHQIRRDLSFLTGVHTHHQTERDSAGGWRIAWQRTIDQLQRIFFPPELAFQRREIYSDDYWFTLLRDDVTVKETPCSVSLECALSEETADALSAYINMALNVEMPVTMTPFPIYITLHWGEYNQRIKMSEQGRVRFPDIPIPAVFDMEHHNIISDLDLAIEVGS